MPVICSTATSPRSLRTAPAVPGEVMDFTYVRTWAGFVYVAFILDVYAQRIVAWNIDSTKAVELVDIPLRMALWQRGREGSSDRSR